MTTPTITTDRYAGDLHDFYSLMFDGVLKNASRSNEDWKHRIESFEHVSLLEFVVPSNIEPKPINFDEKRFHEDAKYRAIMKRKLANLKIPPKWTRHKLTLHKDKIDDDDYRSKMAKVLAFKWVKLLHPIEDLVELIPLFRSDIEDLEYLLDHVRMSAVSAAWCSEMLMRRLANRLLDENEKFLEIEASIREAGKEAREKFKADMDLIGAEVMASASESFNAILEDTNRKLDDALDEIKRSSEESRRRSAEAMDKHGIDPDEDREETFRRAVRRRELERKWERRARWRARPFWVRMLPGLSVAAVSAAMFFFLEVNGSTPIEWLKLLIA